MLLKREADINIKDKEGNTPLGTAIRYDKDSIQLLLRYRADVNATNRMGETPLFHTIEINDIQKMEILVNADANVNIQDVNGNTALHIATDKGYSALIELLLLKANANVNIVNKWGETPLHKAVSAKSEDAVELLLKHQPDIYATNCRHETPLLLAVVKEHIPIIIHLLSEAILPNQNKRVIESIEREADIDLLNELSLDREGNNEELIHAILKVAAQVTDQAPIGIKSLNTALELQNQEIDRILLRNFHVMYHEMIEKFTDVGTCTRQDNLIPLLSHHNVKHLLEKCLSSEIDFNDVLPKQICERCFLKLSNFCVFQDEILYHDREFRQLLNKSQLLVDVNSYEDNKLEYDVRDRVQAHTLVQHENHRNSNQVDQIIDNTFKPDPKADEACNKKESINHSTTFEASHKNSYR
ncbi:Zinc-finger associated domain (zf-AD) [Popillia japonica]|uniref:Zinc-finger associated domain (Zf-AD) n=1 Tax=Popillia japonica TaxID=7064 RepID=A0AAW1KDF8_POPJA